MFSIDLEVLRNRPIPNQDEAKKSKQGYRQWPIDTGHPESKEPCVELQQLGIAGRNHYVHPHNAPYYEAIPGSTDRLLLRQSVARRLLSVNDALLRAGLELFVYDAWRPAAVQHQMACVWFPKELRRRHPHWSDEEVAKEAANYWAPGPAEEESIDLKSPPPHSTGAAVDLTIRWIRGDPLWMGTIFDDVSELAHTGALENPPEGEFSFSVEEARRNRRLLYWIMAAAGLVNNPTEWWHFSWGDQMWAKLTSGQGATRDAHYSAINLL